MRTKGIIKNRNGFTLVELLVAIALFGVLMVAFLSLFMTAFRMTLRAGDRDSTVANISGKVEQSMAGVAVSPQPSAAVTSIPSTVTIIYSNQSISPEVIKVTQTTGTAAVQDGPDVIITSYEYAS